MTSEMFIRDCLVEMILKEIPYTVRTGWRLMQNYKSMWITALGQSEILLYISDFSSFNKIGISVDNDKIRLIPDGYHTIMVELDISDPDCLDKIVKYINTVVAYTADRALLRINLDEQGSKRNCGRSD